MFAETFTDSNGHPAIEAKAARPGLFNYFIGNDPANWKTDVRAYSELLYHDVWPGIDFRISANGFDLEQEFVIRPGADLRKVSVAYEGIERLQVAADGSLVSPDGIRPASREQTSRLPGSRRKENVHPRAVRPAREFNVRIHGRFVSARIALAVDPTLLYSTYLGGSLYDVGLGIAADAAGNAYVTGDTESTDFPVTPGTFQATCPSSNCPVSAFVTKLSALGIPVYSTFLGSNAGFDQGLGIGVDLAGEAYVTGIGNGGFPTTSSAYYPFCSASAFLTKLNAAGNGLLYSTCLNGGGNNQGNGVAVDASGNAYVTGTTTGGIFTTPNAYQPAITLHRPELREPGRVRLHSEPGRLWCGISVYSTYLGGGDTEWGNAIAVDAYGSVYVGGATYGPHFPVSPFAFQKTYALGGCDIPVLPCGNAFVAKINPNVAGTTGLNLFLLSWRHRRRWQPGRHRSGRCSR